MGVAGRRRLEAAALAAVAALAASAAAPVATAPALEARPAGAEATAIQAPDRDSARLAAARITIVLAGDTARVEAMYRFAGGASPPGARPLDLTAFRLRGQRLEAEAGGQEGGADGGPHPPAVTGLPGLWRVRLAGEASGAAGETEAGTGGAELRYRVVGRIDRIPLFVPASRTLSTGGRFTIVVRNAPRGLDPSSAFPRFESDGEGALVARPSELPGFVQLPRAGAPLGVGTAADAGVALSLLAGLGGWALLRRRTRAGPRRGASGPAGPSRSSA